MIVAVRALGVARHFQATQQLDIAREVADCCLDRAGLPVRTGILRPRLLEHRLTLGGISRLFPKCMIHVQLSDPIP